MYLTLEEHTALCEGGPHCSEHSSILALILREHDPSCPAYPTEEEAAALWRMAYQQSPPSSSISAIIDAEDRGAWGLAISLARALLQEVP